MQSGPDLYKFDQKEEWAWLSIWINQKLEAFVGQKNWSND